MFSSGESLRKQIHEIVVTMFWSKGQVMVEYQEPYKLFLVFPRRWSM